MFHVFQEAVPHDLWNCEYPGCSVTFVPYFVWGVRHHCRVCGITVCHDHCAKNITLSSRLLQPTYTDLSSVQTPILATSLHQTDLPQQLMFKYACSTCTSQTVSSPPPTASSEQSEAEALRTQLAQLQAELASKTSDVTALSDMMHVYSERLVSLQDTIEILESQLRENNTESATNVKKRRQLSELRDELQRLTPMHSYYNADCEESENDGASNVNYATTKYASPPFKATNSAYNSTTKEPTVSTIFYSMLSQAYEGIVAVTPSVLRSTAYPVDIDTRTNTKSNTTSTSNNYNRQHPNAQQSTVDHSVLHRGTVSATRVNRPYHTAGELPPATPVRVLFPPCDTTRDAMNTSDSNIEEVHSIGEIGFDSCTVNGSCVISSTNTSTAICAVTSDDSACFSRAQSAHVEYCDIYACISPDEYMTHSVVRLESCVPPTPVRGTADNGFVRKESGDSTSGNSGERSVEKSKVNIMEGVFIPNPLMAKRKSI